MGQPAHYSRDIAERCQSLIAQLLPTVQKGLPGDDRFRGPLTTTFLLAMATPMVVLPVERMFKPALGIRGVADDRALNEGLAELVYNTLGPGRTFAQTPFLAKLDWRYVPGLGPFNLADKWPFALLEHLNRQDAVRSAAETPAKEIIMCLRNALAHGGITYLDAEGRQSDGPAVMLGFAGAIMKKGKIVGLNVLRTSQSDFADFLNAWAEWLREARVAQLLNEQAALAA